MPENRKTILAIDDDISILTSLRNALEVSFDVSLAKNIEIAKTILAKTNVDLILLDMDMPGVSGLDFLDLLHGNRSFYHIPVIIVSSYGTPDIILEAKKKGAVDFAVKPITPRILLTKIHSAIQNTKTRINKTGISRKLQVLENSCITGKSSRVEEIIKDIEQFYCDLETDSKVAEICIFAKEMEYKLVNEKIKQLLISIAEQ